MKFLKFLLGLFAILLLGFSINHILLASERKKIEGYGRKIEVQGDMMNVVEKGVENKQVIIIDPGYGTTAPGLDFTPFMDELSKDFHVVAIEPFGYGDSDQTDRPRTVENITEEFHEAITKLGLKDYILCSHSISGIYSLYYLNEYGYEVKGFIGMDTSVPNQLHYTGNVFYPHLRRWANKLGFIRLASWINPKWFMADNEYYSDEVKDQIRYRLYRDFANDNNLNEGLHFEDNWSRIKDLKYPPEIRKIFFLTKKEDENKDWRYIETENTFEHHNGKIYLMEGTHYIFRDNFKAMSKIIVKEFLEQ